MKTLILFISIVLFVFVVNTNDVAAQWYQIPQMQYVPVTCFLVISDSTLFVGGQQHSLYRSTDGGETWVNTSGEIPADTILSLESAGKYIFTGTNTGVYRSSDVGSTWETVNAGFAWPSTPINQFANVDTVLYAATEAGVYRSTDLGTSWIPEDRGLATGKTPLITYTVATLGIVSAYSGLFVTQDLLGGAYVLQPEDTTWRYVGLGAHWCDAGALIVVDTGIFAGTWDGIFLYSGSDTTWLPRRNGLPQYLEYCIFATADSLLFALIGGVSQGFYVTSDFGDAWTLVNSSSFGGAKVNSIVASKKYLFAGTGSGAWRIPIADIATSVNDHRSQLPAQYALYQNYPNPCNPSTIISYQLPMNTLVTLKVYDELGRLVKTLVDDRQAAGTHSVTFNATSLSSGVYFYRLAAGSFVQTKKLVLIK